MEIEIKNEFGIEYLESEGKMKGSIARMIQQRRRELTKLVNQRSYKTHQTVVQIARRQRLLQMKKRFLRTSHVRWKRWYQIIKKIW